MKKKKLVFLAFATIAIALLLEAGILKYVNDSNTYRMSKVLLDRVITVLNKSVGDYGSVSGFLSHFYCIQCF